MNKRKNKWQRSSLLLCCCGAVVVGVAKDRKGRLHGWGVGREGGGWWVRWRRGKGEGGRGEGGGRREEGCLGKGLRRRRRRRRGVGRQEGGRGGGNGKGEKGGEALEHRELRQDVGWGGVGWRALEVKDGARTELLCCSAEEVDMVVLFIIWCVAKRIGRQQYHGFYKSKVTVKMRKSHRHS